MRQRKSPRLQGYDYTLPGAYFVTINTYQSTMLFGEVSNGEMILNTLGNQAFICWYDIPNHYPHITLDAFVVMPNHIHGILFLGEVLNEKAASLSTVIAIYKGAVTRAIHSTGFEGTVWHGRFYDHIIRKQDSLDKIRVYIADNPTRWGEKEDTANF